MKILMLVLPVCAIVFFVAVKLPPKFRDIFYLVPTWISSALIAWLIGHHMGGVMGGYAGLVCDIMLMPAFAIMKRRRESQRLHEGLEPKISLKNLFPRTNYGTLIPSR